MHRCAGRRSWACIAVLMVAVGLASLNVVQDAPHALTAAVLAGVAVCVLAAVALIAARAR